MKKKVCKVALLLTVIILFTNSVAFIASGSEIDIPVAAAVEEGEKELTCKNAVLMEASTGKILYEKKKDEKTAPASITKIMTLVLIFDALDNGKIKLDQEVVTSEHAKSMGGSQVFLETGEKQTVETLIKCIVMASGNDASVAMAECIGGSEENFVRKMNDKAKELGMKNTHFVDCCGLTDSDDHYTSANDVAIMARELITKHPQIHKYATIWMEDMIHKTKQGEKIFTLTNTNKLLKQYDWITGLKTGSTKKAGYCVCETGKQNGMELISVIMGSENYKTRFQEAATLLNYGYGEYSVYTDQSDKEVKLKLEGALSDEFSAVQAHSFTYLLDSKMKKEEIIKKIVSKPIEAPISKNQKVAEVHYFYENNEIGKVDLLASENIKKAGFGNYISIMVANYFRAVLQ